MLNSTFTQAQLESVFGSNSTDLFDFRRNRMLRAGGSENTQKKLTDDISEEVDATLRKFAREVVPPAVSVSGDEEGAQREAGAPLRKLTYGDKTVKKTVNLDTNGIVASAVYVAMTVPGMNQRMLESFNDAFVAKAADFSNPLFPDGPPTVRSVLYFSPVRITDPNAPVPAAAAAADEDDGLGAGIIILIILACLAVCAVVAYFVIASRDEKPKPKEDKVLSFYFEHKTSFHA